MRDGFDYVDRGGRIIDPADYDPRCEHGNDPDICDDCLEEQETTDRNIGALDSADLLDTLAELAQATDIETMSVYTVELLAASKTIGATMGATNDAVMTWNGER